MGFNLDFDAVCAAANGAGEAWHRRTIRAVIDELVHQIRTDPRGADLPDEFGPAIEALLSDRAAMAQAGEELPSLANISEAFIPGCSTACDTGGYYEVAGANILDLIRPTFARLVARAQAAEDALINMTNEAEHACHERDALLALAYIGDHYHPDHTYKARLEELDARIRSELQSKPGELPTEAAQRVRRERDEALAALSGNENIPSSALVRAAFDRAVVEVLSKDPDDKAALAQSAGVRAVEELFRGVFAQKTRECEQLRRDVDAYQVAAQTAAVDVAQARKERDEAIARHERLKQISKDMARALDAMGDIDTGGPADESVEARIRRDGAEIGRIATALDRVAVTRTEGPMFRGRILTIAERVEILCDQYAETLKDANERESSRVQPGEDVVERMFLLFENTMKSVYANGQDGPTSRRAGVRAVLASLAAMGEEAWLPKDSAFATVLGIDQFAAMRVADLVQAHIAPVLAALRIRIAELEALLSRRGSTFDLDAYMRGEPMRSAFANALASAMAEVNSTLPQDAPTTPDRIDAAAEPVDAGKGPSCASASPPDVVAPVRIPEVGQRVRVNDLCSTYYGRIGTVANVDAQRARSHWVQLYGMTTWAAFAPRQLVVLDDGPGSPPTEVEPRVDVPVREAITDVPEELLVAACRWANESLGTRPLHNDVTILQELLDGTSDIALQWEFAAVGFVRGALWRRDEAKTVIDGMQDLLDSQEGLLAKENERLREQLATMRRDPVVEAREAIRRIVADEEQRRGEDDELDREIGADVAKHILTHLDGAAVASCFACALKSDEGEERSE